MTSSVYHLATYGYDSVSTSNCINKLQLTSSSQTDATQDALARYPLSQSSTYSCNECVADDLLNGGVNVISDATSSKRIVRIGYNNK